MFRTASPFNLIGLLEQDLYSDNNNESVKVIREPQCKIMKSEKNYLLEKGTNISHMLYKLWLDMWISLN